MHSNVQINPSACSKGGGCKVAKSRRPSYINNKHTYPKCDKTWQSIAFEAHTIERVHPNTPKHIGYQPYNKGPHVKGQGPQTYVRVCEGQ